MPSSQLTLCRPLLILPSVFPSIRVFSSEFSLFQKVQRLFASGGQSVGASASASVLPMNIQDWFSRQNPAWDLNPCVWDSNPAKTHSTWFQGLMKLRFLMSHRRKNSVRDKVIGKMWIYSDSERSTLHRHSVVSFFQSVRFSCSVVSDSVIPWTAAHQASLSITNSRVYSNLCP